jgi:hypothetical protein
MSRGPATRRRAAVLAAALSLTLAPPPPGAVGQEPACSTPEGFAAFEASLPRTVKALVEGGEMVIVTLGGSSTLGTAAGKPDLAWPARMGATLSARYPTARIRVSNLAQPRQTAREAVLRLTREVLPMKPTLVIWETGTVEAVHGKPVEEFRDTVQEGIDELSGAGIEVVLMNAQFSRDTDAMIPFAPYLAALRELADANDVPVFHRHGLMRYWDENGVLDFRVKGSEQRRRLAGRLYDCLGRAMADFVARGSDADPAEGGRRP